MRENIVKLDFRQELLREDIVPRQLNSVAQQYKDLLLEELRSGIIETEQVTVCQCGSQRLEPLARIDRFGLPFGSLICQDCGLVITSPRIKEENLPYYYDKYYYPLNYGKEYVEEQEALFALGQGRKIFSILKRSLPQKSVIRVLEIGAGTGSVLQEFKDEAKKNAIEVDELGTEYSQSCIQECLGKDLNIIYGNIQSVVQRGETFDVIILSHVFEHFVDLHKEMDDLKKLMSPESLLYIEVPGILVNHKRHYYGFSFLGYLIHAHMYNFCRDSLVSLLSSSGLSALYHNEEVEAVFKLGETQYAKNTYHKIMDYLEFLVENERYFQDVYQKNILAKEELRRWLDKEKEETAKVRRWLDKEKEETAKVRRWLDKEKDKLKEIGRLHQLVTQTNQYKHPIEKKERIEGLLRYINDLDLDVKG